MVGAVLVVALALLSGCARTSEAERRAIVDETWRETVAFGDESVATLIALHPELTLAETAGEFSGERWIDCSGSTVGDAVSPTEVSWSSSRDVRVDPARETASLADSLAEWLEGQGWRELEASGRDGGHVNLLARDGYSIRLGSDEVVPDWTYSGIHLIVSSPCVSAPERMIDWTPPTDAPTGEPSGGAVAPTPSVAGSTS